MKRRDNHLETERNISAFLSEPSQGFVTVWTGLAVPDAVRGKVSATVT